MWNARRDLISSHCSWCDRIWTGKEWLEERRPRGRVIYAHGICEACASEHFAGAQDRTQLNVQRFRMRPALT
jgi:hypothetical protein